jgi:hypothetical protein
MRKMTTVLLAAIALVLPVAAQSSVLIKGEKALGFYGFQYRGQLDLTGMSPLGLDFGPGQSVTPFLGEFLNYVGPVELYATPPLPAFGSGGEFIADEVPISFGDDFSVFGNGTIGLPAGYQSNDPLSGLVLFCCSVTAARIGLTPGTEVTTFLPSGDTIRLVVPVPLPATFPVLLGAVAAIGLLRRRAD